MPKRLVYSIYPTPAERERLEAVYWALVEERIAKGQLPESKSSFIMAVLMAGLETI